jgi:glycosyltransferase involved in cell wall biosynthesis/CMP-N-acetylneuraminic acid synthetase
MSSPKISVIVTAYNYDQYIETALDSALDQTFEDFEIVVVDDGSTDETPEILKEYSYEHADKIKPITLEGVGLASACNRGIEVAEGDYIVRLDADDYFDENILTVESSYLDSNPEAELVYPDYYTVDKDGEIIDHVRLPKIGEEVKLLNRSPLAAGAMYRKGAWKAIGGYNESLEYQEDYQFWINFITEFDVYNINLPLMYYRQHDSSMSTNFAARMDARRDVKRDFVNTRIDTDELTVLGIIPARRESRVSLPNHEDTIDNLALSEIAGRPLLDYSITESLASTHIDRLIVSTEDYEIAKISRDLGAEVPFMREDELSDSTTQLWEVVESILYKIDSDDQPDIIVILPYVTPLRTADQIDEAVDTSLMFSVDSVISVYENKRFLWRPGKYGLEPLFEKRLLRRDRETTYHENGAIYVTKPETVRNQGELIGQHVGHILMQNKNSVHIDSWFDYKTCEDALSEGRIGYDNDELNNV